MLGLAGFLVPLRHYSLKVKAAAGVLVLATEVFLFLTNRLDPGIIPPNAVKDPLIARLDRCRRSRHVSSS